MPVNQTELLKEPIKKLQELYSLQTSTERSYYPAICSFLEILCNSKGNFHAIPEESRNKGEENIGFPDITLRHGDKIIGYLEIKLPMDSIGSPKHQKQFTKYKDSFENLIITNLIDWELWQWNDSGKPVLAQSTHFNPMTEELPDTYLELIARFMHSTSYTSRTPTQLAYALAKKAQIFSSVVEQELTGKQINTELEKLFNVLKEQLQPTLDEHRFSNLVAETVTYALFLAALERKDEDLPLTLTTALDFLPKNVKVFRDLYRIITRAAEETRSLQSVAESILNQIDSSDITRIKKRLTTHNDDEDPVILFYEPFLEKFDPEERKNRGVYYTPKQVVDFIIRGTDSLLKTNYTQAHKGIATEDIDILDPATGTGTFLMSAIQHAHKRIVADNERFGAQMTQDVFNDYVLKNVLKNFYGFEILAAPFAIAHLKLGLELQRLGFKWEMTYNDSDKDNNRLQIYLADTLDSHDTKPPTFGLESISEETQLARAARRDSKILAIVGNPPYAGISMNLADKMLAVEPYKFLHGQPIKTRGNLQFVKNINDDYIKFIRFAEQLISVNGQGVVSYITNNGFLDNESLVGMRASILNTFNEIYVINLYGAKDNKPTADDQSVFTIRLGTAITFFVKHQKPSGTCKLFYTELTGNRRSKLEKLEATNFEQIKWQELEPKLPNYSFLPMKTNNDVYEVYQGYVPLDEIFDQYQVGIITAADGFFLDKDKHVLEQRAGSLSHIKDPEILSLLYPFGKSSSKKLQAQFKRSGAYINQKVEFIPINYRPYEQRYLLYDPQILEKPQVQTVDNFRKENIAIGVTRQVNESFNHVFATNIPIESSFVSNKTKEINNIFRLYNYSEKTSQTSMLDERTLNLKPEFMKILKQNCGISIDANSSKDFLGYMYAILHSQTYRNKFAELLKRGFPRIPLPSSMEQFNTLAGMGKALIDASIQNNYPSAELLSIKVEGDQPTDSEDWLVTNVTYDEDKKRVYINSSQYFEGVTGEQWYYAIGVYQPLRQWLEFRQKEGCVLTLEMKKHYISIVTSIQHLIDGRIAIDKYTKQLFDN